MKRKRIVSMLLVATMAATLFAGCGNDSGKKGGTETGSAKEFDAFFAVPGTEINDDNEIQKIIEEKTGVRVKETWLTGQTADEAIGTMIAGGEYPDFIEGASGQMQLYDAARFCCAKRLYAPSGAFGADYSQGATHGKRNHHHRQARRVDETVKKGQGPFLTKFAVCYAHNLFADGEQITHLQPEKYFRPGTRPGRK